MPYSMSKLPPAAEKLSKKQKEIFIAVANNILSEEEDEGKAISAGLAQAKKYKESMKKSLLESISDLIEKAFGDVSSEEPVEVFDGEMVSYEVIYEPLVKDAHGEWMSNETIEAAMNNFNENLKKGVVKANLFHMKNTDLFTVEDTWIQKEMDVQVVQTGEVIKAGTWVAKIKYNDKALWELKKSNVIGGVSIGGKGYVNPETGEITNVTFDEE